MDRRAFIERALVLVGSAAVLPADGQSPAPARELAWSASQASALEEVADLIIPATGTPGARQAGVGEILRELLAHWASPATIAGFRGVVESIDAAAVGQFGAALLALEPARRLQVVTRYDLENVGDDAGFYGRLKELILLAYYHSQTGATQELRYELIPGAYHGCVPFTDSGRGWAD